MQQEPISHNDNSRITIPNSYARTKGGLLGHHAVAIFGEFLTIGYLKSKMYGPNFRSESDFESSWIHAKQIKISDIRQIEETIKKQGKVKIHIKFSIHTINGKQHNFCLPHQGSYEIREGLSHIPNVSYMSRNEIHRYLKLLSIIVIIPLFIFSIAVIVVILSETFKIDSGSKVVIAMATILLTLLWLLKKIVQRYRRRTFKLVDANFLNQRNQAEIKEKATLHKNIAKEPFYSIGLGWSLKIIALIYYVFLISPYSDALTNSNNYYLLTLLWVVCIIILYTGYQISQRPYSSSKNDDRDPIVYLRSFAIDGNTSLQPRGIIGWITGAKYVNYTKWIKKFFNGGFSKMGHHLLWVGPSMFYPIRLLRIFLNMGGQSTEESIARFFSSYGPVIAVGRPGERLATPGAQRTYLKDDKWQSVVETKVNIAQIILIQPGVTAGLHWELGLIREKIEPTKVILCMVEYWDEPEGYKQMKQTVKEAMNIELPEKVPDLPSPSFIYFDTNWKPYIQEVTYRNPLLWPLLPDATNLSETLKPFLNSTKEKFLHPVDPHWNKGFSRFIVGLIGASIALLLWIAPSFLWNQVSDLNKDLSPKMSISDIEWTKIHSQKVLPYELVAPLHFKGRNIPNKKSRNIDYHLVSEDLQMEIIVLTYPGSFNDLDSSYHQYDRLEYHSEKYGRGKASVRNHQDFAINDRQWYETEILTEVVDDIFQIEISKTTEKSSEIFRIYFITHGDKTMTKLQSDIMKTVFDSIKLK